MEKLKVGICGWGNVATGLFNALVNNADMIASNAGAQFTVSVIGARRDNPKCDPGSTPVERDIVDVINHDIDVVVELIGGVEVARELIIKAIKNKKHVVTANKAVIYHHGDEIFKLAKENGVKVLFESAVCAGTPIIKLLNSNNYHINNLDINLICEQPKISKFRDKIINSLSCLLDLNKNLINLKGKTTEKLGLIGKEKAIACEVICSISK